MTCDVTRRDALIGGSAAAMALGLGPLPARAAPRPGGVFRIGLGHGSTSDSNDPQTYENDFTIFTGNCYRGQLTMIAPDGSLEGDLATEWDTSADARTWSFKLKPGVAFHNGKTVTVGDVIASFNHHRGADSKSAAKPLVDPITAIRADGDRVVFELDRGNADFPFLVSDYHIAIMPEKDGGADWQSNIGTGPFKLAQWEAGVRATFERDPNFHRQRPWFDGLEVLVIADASARTNALKSDQIDMMDRVDLKTARLLGRDPEIDLLEVSGTAHYTIPMITTVAPFDDNNVRLALKYALDREELVQKILHGHGVVGNDHPIGLANRYPASELEQRAYDPDKAKFHLKQAGLTALTVTLHTADAAFEGAVNSAILYKEHAAKAGITINVAREPNDGYWSTVWLKKPWCFSYWSGRPTEDWMFSTTYAEGAPWNETFWSHERFNKLLVEARSELDETKRRALYVEMQALCRDEGGAVVPMFNNYVNAVRTRVGLPDRIASNWNNDGHKAGERWWFKS